MMGAKMKGNTMRNLVLAAVLASLSVGCGYSKDIKEYPEPWQTLDPGKPLEKFPKIEILEQGGGAIIEPGDLVQLHIKYWSTRDNDWGSHGEWWIWIGFRTSKETAFFAIEPEMSSALVRFMEGGVFRFLEGKDQEKLTPQGTIIEKSHPLELAENPFGDDNYYRWRQLKSRNSISVPGTSGYDRPSRIEIKRVCKGPLQYRTVRLFDDSPIRASSGGFGTRIVRDPREAWIDEARIEAKCSDGKTAVFQYGPTASYNGKRGRSPVMGYFDDWLRDAWQKIPRGVLLK